MGEMYAIIGIAKLKSAGNISGVLSHMTRQRETPNSNGRENNVLIQPQPLPEIMEYIKSFMPRRNAVLAYDVLLTASPDFFTGKSETQLQEWAEASVKWACDKFGGRDNVKAAVMHRDETTPHISLLIVPEHEQKLNARYYTGGRQKMRELWTQYAQAVKRFGLKRGREFSPAEHRTIKEYYADIKRGAELATGRKFTADELPPPTMGDHVNPAEYAVKLVNHIANHFRQQNGNLKAALIATEKELERVKETTAHDRKLMQQLQDDPGIIDKLREALAAESRARATEQGKYERLITAVSGFFRRNVPKNDSLRRPENLGELLNVPELQQDLRITLTPDAKPRQGMTRERG